MPEELQHVCYILSFITYQKYRSLHVLDCKPEQSGHLEDLSSGLGGAVVFGRL